jgi:hypothetical protein
VPSLVGKGCAFGKMDNLFYPDYLVIFRGLRLYLLDYLPSPYPNFFGFFDAGFK